MSLDLIKVAAQVGGMVAGLKSGRQERHAHLRCALEVLGDKSINLEQLKRKMSFSMKASSLKRAAFWNFMRPRNESTALKQQLHLLTKDICSLY